MSAWTCFFSLAGLCYIYIGYPVLIWLLARLLGRDPKKDDECPHVSLLIPAYNEQDHIAYKIENALELDYPRERLEIVVASDGSTDSTEEIVRSFEEKGVQLFVMEENIGKSAMLSRTVPLLKGEIVVFSDASSSLEHDSLKKLVRSFADERVGCVSGLYSLIVGGDLRSRGERLYWKYETFLKTQESRLESILGAHGAFYAIRKTLFKSLGKTSINDDYLIPMRIVAQGYRAIYEPTAVAWEKEVSSVEGEFSRRRRIAMGNCQQIVELKEMLNPRYGWVAFCFLSHKVLRTFSPLLLIAFLVSSLMMNSPEREIFLVLQVGFYGAALLGAICQRLRRAISWFSPPMYFCLTNLAMLDGLTRFCLGQRRTRWGAGKDKA